MRPQDQALQDLLARLDAGERLEDLLRALELAGDDSGLAEDLTLAAGLRRALPMRMPPARRARMQAELQAAFERSRGSAVRPSARGRLGARLLLRASGLVAALLLALGSAVVVSADSLPGELLYPVKRAAEQGRLVLTPSALGRAKLRLTISAARMDELRRLADAGLAISPSQVEALLEAQRALLEEASAAGDATLLEAARSQTAEHRQELVELGPDLPGGLRDRVDDASRLLESLERELRPAPSPRPAATIALTPSPVSGTEPAGSGLAPTRVASPGLPSVTPVDPRLPGDATATATEPPALAASPSAPAAMTALATLLPPSTGLPTEAPPTLVPFDPAATAESRERDRRATRQAREAEATARARAVRATLEAVRATEGAEAARATARALRERERDRRATVEARMTERARRATPEPPPRPATVAPIQPQPTPSP